MFGVFLTLILLAIGNFASNTDIVKAGGIAGVVTAAVAWYAAAAGVVNGMAARHVLPVGKPLNLQPTGK